MLTPSGERGSSPSATCAAALILVCCAVSCASEATRTSQSEPTTTQAPATDASAGPATQDVPQEPVEPSEPVPPGEPATQAPSATPATATLPLEAPEPAPKPRREQLAAPEGEPGAGWVHGSLAVRYRGRFTDDDRDNDARAVLALDIADPATPWIQGHFLARTDIDIDGLHESQLLEDLTNTYDGSVVSKLYLAYADIALDQQRPADSVGVLRVGRQSDPRLPEVLRLDGVTYVGRPTSDRELEFGVYGGIPVHLYDSSYADGDLAFGTFVEGRPWANGWARMDWMHLNDELVLGEERNDLLSLDLWHDLSERWRLEGDFSYLEGAPRDLRLASLYQDAESETNFRATYYELLETQTQRATELDPFFDQLLEYEPFRQLTFNASHLFGKSTLIDVGLDLRRVSHSADVGEFNREWERYYVTATLRELGTEALALSVTADLWDGDEQDTSSLGADLSYSPEDRWSAAIGTYYSLYKYELLELSERDDVRTYYIRTGKKLSSSLGFDAEYDLEDDDFEIYHTLRLGLAWRF